MPRAQQTTNCSRVSHETPAGTRLALWWLRHYESIIHFWTGFSWVWVIGILLFAVVGYLDVVRALATIVLIGVIANTGVYLAVRTLANYLKGLQDGPEKEEAHDLMVEIMRRRAASAG